MNNVPRPMIPMNPDPEKRDELDTDRRRSAAREEA